ncbi:MAG: ATP-dependent protease subunit HslV [Candidatus Eisenbacteria bacterium]|nr:ATP-dependent protease subunit HslV [Candidatus Eisenbacteria bacterium]
MRTREHEPTRSTTVLAVVRDGRAAMAGDGQVTAGQTILKASARKVRRLHNGTVLAGLAGSAADGLHLLDRFETALDSHGGALQKAAIEMAKFWRSDKILRRLEAQLAVADKEHVLLLSGNGDVVEPEDGIVAVGSGAAYALAACRALARHTELPPGEMAVEALRIAAQICIFTNDQIYLEEL